MSTSVVNKDALGRFDVVSPFDGRYYLADPEFFQQVRPFLSEGAQIRYLAIVESALASTLAEVGVCSQDVADAIDAACKQIDPEEVYREESRIQHNIRALVNCIRGRIPAHCRPFVHLFATSADIMDTARALSLRDVTGAVIVPTLAELVRKLIRLARQHADTPQMGRTHGRHAVPITFGFAIALYISRLGQRLERIVEAAENLRGKFSGAVGGYNSLCLYAPQDPQAIEALLMRKLGLRTPEISSQVAQPEYLADYVYALTSCWGVLANLADDMRHLLRSEIREITDRIESDAQTQIVGSSTMPHKVNPKDFENIKSLWKAYLPRLLTPLLDQISEHQRDLTNSASSRFATEFAAAFAYGSRRTSMALDTIKPDPARMGEVLEEGKDPVAAEPLYILLSLHGHPDAHEAVRVLSRQSRVTKRPLAEVIREDAAVSAYLANLNAQQKAALEDPGTYRGATSGRTIGVCDEWERALPLLESRLPNPLEDAPT